MDEARDQGSAGNDSVPPRFARLIGQPAPAFSLGGLQGATVPSVRSWPRTALSRSLATTAAGK